MVAPSPDGRPSSANRPPDKARSRGWSSVSAQTERIEFTVQPGDYELVARSTRFQEPDREGVQTNARTSGLALRVDDQGEKTLIVSDLGAGIRIYGKP